MQLRQTWKCEGCGGKRPLRKIDEHRWVRVPAISSDGPKDDTRLVELCPSCRFRALRGEALEKID